MFPRKKRKSKDGDELMRLVITMDHICICTLTGLCNCYELKKAPNGEIASLHREQLKKVDQEFRRQVS